MNDPLPRIDTQTSAVPCGFPEIAKVAILLDSDLRWFNVRGSETQ
jgi:hypothetical protein